MAETRKARRLINGKWPHIPFWMRAVGLIFICFTFLLFAAILRSRGATSSQPRVHFVQDMDNQVKGKAQHASSVFADGRVSRPKIIGTVAHGKLNADDHLYRGFSASWNVGTKKFDVQFINGFPVKVDDALLKRGQVKFNTYCMPCHGYDGRGAGPVHVRAEQLANEGKPGMAWVPPTNLTDSIRMGRQDGHLYNTIVNGIRNMGAYGPAIPDPNDRWAIVAYVRALQLSATGAKAPAAPQAAAN